MKVAIIVSESSVNHLKFVSGGGVLSELRKRSIDCSLVILVRKRLAKRRFFSKNVVEKSFKKMLLRFFLRGEKSFDLRFPPKRVTPNIVFHWFEKSLGSKNVKQYEKELNEFIDSNPSQVLITDNLNNPKFLDLLKKYSIDLAVFKGGEILRKEFLDHFKIGVINLHGSGPLPYYRGLGSLEFALIDEKPIYMNIHLIDTGIDTGPILLRKELKLRGDESLAEMYGEINAYSIGVFVDAVEGLSSGTLISKPQKLDAGRQHFLPHPLLEDYALKELRNRHSSRQIRDKK